MAMGNEARNLAMLRPCLAECTVLLKNGSPFRVENPCKVALFGNGVRHTKKGGTGSGEVNSRHFPTIEEAFRERGFTISTSSWLDGYDKALSDSRAAFVKSVKREAREHHKFYLFYCMGKTRPECEFNMPLDGEGDLAIYVLTRTSGEGNDRHFDKGDFLLTDSEIAAIHELDRRFERFLLVLNVGGPVDLSPVMDIRNILLLSQLGVDTANVLVDIVLGQANPSGRLSTTWASASSYHNTADFGAWDDTFYREGIYVGYRHYATSGVPVLFPFGYGLSFAEFSQKVTSVSVCASTIKVDVKITNTGSESGKDVVQLYVSVPQGTLDQPSHVLAGFAKSPLLEPGSSSVVQVCFDMADLASFSASQSSYILEKGPYVLLLGQNSRDVQAFAVASLDRDVIVKKVKAFGSGSGLEEKCFGRPAVDLEGLPVYEVSASDFETSVVCYDQVESSCPEVSSLSETDLVRMSVGHFATGGLASVIGEASTAVCGAAGETSSVPTSGIPALVMADGPAGLRLAKDYFRDSKGLHSTKISVFEGFDEIAGPLVKAAMKLISPKPKKGTEIQHQYCTAIPIGTALAQSFNTDFARLCGDIVGSEMENFGVHLWLAPAMNIHRSVLCGRNFEYYSEDPLLSGKVAAAISNGVQSHKGCGVTIKHYCANNQETNRYANNSVVSERALRDIYLKPFEICIREAKPVSVMTSYNLLNGVHTSENRALVEDILRCDFGFDGFVMTDWVVSVMAPGKESKYTAPSACAVANAGNDVFMPGSQAEIDDLLSGLKSGRVTRAQIEHNVSRVVRVIERLF